VRSQTVRAALVLAAMLVGFPGAVAPVPAAGAQTTLTIAVAEEGGPDTPDPYYGGTFVLGLRCEDHARVETLARTIELTDTAPEHVALPGGGVCTIEELDTGGFLFRQVWLLLDGQRQPKFEHPRHWSLGIADGASAQVIVWHDHSRTYAAPEPFWVDTELEADGYDLPWDPAHPPTIDFWHFLVVPPFSQDVRLETNLSGIIAAHPVGLECLLEGGPRDFDPRTCVERYTVTPADAEQGHVLHEATYSGLTDELEPWRVVDRTTIYLGNGRLTTTAGTTRVEFDATASTPPTIGYRHVILNLGGALLRNVTLDEDRTGSIPLPDDGRLPEGVDLRPGEALTVHSETTVTAEDAARGYVATTTTANAHAGGPLPAMVDTTLVEVVDVTPAPVPNPTAVPTSRPVVAPPTPVATGELPASGAPLLPLLAAAGLVLLLGLVGVRVRR
jgi:hypothetical protein